MLRVAVVPGVGVRRYAVPLRDRLRQHGFDARLLPAPGQLATECDLRDYGEWLAGQLVASGPVGVLVGLSVGGQAAAVAAASLDRSALTHLVLVGPTVDPDRRSMVRLLARWAWAGRLERPSLLREQLPDWAEVGPVRLLSVLRSALTLRLEQVLAGASAELTVVHAERDDVTSHGYAAGLAAAHHGRLVVVPGATHSWPYTDETGLVRLLEGLLDDTADSVLDGPSQAPPRAVVR